MLTQLQLLEQFSVQDLSRALIRQFLFQNNLTKTMEMFEKEDSYICKKINKSIVIKMLNMISLYQQNKTSVKPLTTILQILIQYLRTKFQNNINNFHHNLSKDQQSISMKSNSNKKSQQYEDFTQREDNKFENSQKKKDKQRLTIKTANNFYKQNKKSQSIYEEKIQIVSIIDEQKEKKFNKCIENNCQIEDNVTILKGQKSEPTNQSKLSNQPISRATEVLQRAQTTYKRQIVQDQLINKNQKLAQQLKNKKQQPTQQNIDKPIKVSSKDQINKTQISHLQPNDITSVTAPRRNVMRKIGNKNKQQTFNNISKQSSNTQQLKKKQIQIQQKLQQSKQNIVEKQTSITKNQMENGQKDKQKMVKMFGKKKKEIQEEVVPTKFKFDDNFIDKPLHTIAEPYHYEKIKFNQITLKQKFNPQIQYNQKPIISNTNLKRKNERRLTQQQIQQLKQTIFQYNSPLLPKAWHQGFILSPFKQTPYGLKQIEGGPCGIIAAAQCYFLKHLLYLSKANNQQDLLNDTRRQICLVAALAQMLFKCKNDKVYLLIPAQGFSGSKLDIGSLTLVALQSQSLKTVYQGLWCYKNSFIGQINHGVTVLLYSIVMTKGCQNIKNQIDCPQYPLIGNHGHCTQQLVNLFITGKSSSNCFDGIKMLEDNYKLKGIQQKAQFGFLTVFQALKQIQVGKNLKNPIFPCWIICKQFHYHVIFGSHYLISQNNDAEKFDIVYFDGLYNCNDRIILTMCKFPYGQQPQIKLKQLPLIEQVMMTKWGVRNVDWNGSIKIL